MLTFKRDGKTYQINDLLAAGLQVAADEAAQARSRGDAIETAKVAFEHPDGAVELVLPKGTVDQMLAMIGAMGSPEAEPPAEPSGDELPVEGDELPVEGEETAPPVTEDEKDIPKMDAAAIAKLVDERVGAALKRRDDAARVRGELERKSVAILGDSYGYADADDVQVMLDAVTKADASRADAAGKLAEQARKGDARAAGKLEAFFDAALERHDGETRVDSTGDQLRHAFEVADASSSQRDDSDSAPPWEAARKARIDRASGKAPPETPAN